MNVHDTDRVATVRAFTRFWTNRVGVLHAGLHDTPYSLTEARLIFELAQRDTTEVVDLRRGLDIDAGYLSRVLNRFKANGLIETDPSPTDGRRQVVRLTGQGRTVFTELDASSAGDARAMLATLTEEEQRRLVAAMTTIRDVLGETPRQQPYVLRPLAPGDLGWVVQRHGVLYAQEYGWDETFEALVVRIVAGYAEDHDPKRENAWIAEVDGAPAGCVFCTKKDDTTARLRLLLVEPRARGMGIGARMVEECVRFALRSGYQRLTLWTNDVLAAARRVYQAAGFRLVEKEPHHSFGHDLVGQGWVLDLTPDPAEGGPAPDR